MMQNNKRQKQGDSPSGDDDLPTTTDFHLLLLFVKGIGFGIGLWLAGALFALFTAPLGSIVVLGLLGAGTVLVARTSRDRETKR